jgi:hypothetical protein
MLFRLAPSLVSRWRGCFHLGIDGIPSKGYLSLAMNYQPLFRLLTGVKARIKPTVLVKTADYTITADQALYGAVVSNAGASGTVVFSLPPAVVGARVTALVKAAQELRLDPNGTETVALPSSGVQQAAGKYIVADAIGESANLICLVAGTWDHIGPIDGTWTVQS